MIDFRQIIKDSADTKLRLLEVCMDDIEKASELMLDCVNNGNKILWCGNGGSAADAQHMSAELMGGLRSHARKPIPSIALSTDTSFITAWANDTSYDEIFSRQIEGVGSPGDILIAISTSGNSRNVINALVSAESSEIKSIILTGGTKGKMKEMGNVLISVPSDDTQRIQECHLLIEHILCENTEHNFK